MKSSSLFAMAVVAASLGVGALAQQPPSSAPKPGGPRFRTMTSSLSGLLDQALGAPQANRARILRAAPETDGQRIAVQIRVTQDLATVAEDLRSVGFEVRHAIGNSVEGYGTPEVLQRVATLAGVARIDLIRHAESRVVGQGRVAHKADVFHNNGTSGQGVRVGIIDNFRGIRRLQGVEFPAVLAARCYTSVGQYSSDLSVCDAVESDHGTAVAEALFDVAPSATLVVADVISQSDLREAVEWMTSLGVKVINFSAAYTWDGPGDGTSPYTSSSLNSVDLAVSRGAVFVTAAGNEEGATWAGDFRDASGNSWHEFDGTELNGIVAAANDTIKVQLRWSDSWSRASSDLDLFLYDSSGTTVLARSTDPQVGGQGEVPLEFLTFTPTARGTYQVAVKLDSGQRPAWIQLQVFTSQDLARPRSGYSVGNPGEGFNLGMLSVGAADYSTPSTIEGFSSRGPTIDGRQKPDVVGVDRATSASYGFRGFSGTSQASPHVAGFAALMWQWLGINVGYTPEQIASAVINWAETRGGARPSQAWGYGLVSIPPSSTTSGVPFPNRADALEFRNQLEAKYRDGLRRSAIPLYADAEGSVVWTQEYLRYRLNNCDHSGASLRAWAQIRSRGVLSTCGRPVTTSTVAFPPRDQTTAFRSFLEIGYRDVLRRAPSNTHVDMEGDVVWVSEYYRYRLNRCDHQQAVQRVMLQIDGRGVQPTCQ